MRKTFVEKRNVAAACVLTKRALYLREDALGRSYSLDEPLPNSVNKRDFWIAVNGANGHRFYQFGPDEYPLYWQLTQLEDAGEQSRASEVDQQLEDEVLAFTDAALALIDGPSTLVPR